MDVKGVIERVWNHREAGQEWLPEKAGVPTFLPCGTFVSPSIVFMKTGRASQLALCPLEQEGMSVPEG